MKFNTTEERNKAMEEATKAVGEAYGKLKYAEWVMKETSQSYTPDVAHQAPTPETPKEEKEEVKEDPEVKPKAKRKSKAKPKPAPEPEPTTASDEDATKADESNSTAGDTSDTAIDAEADSDGSAEATEAVEECPITSAPELRDLMTKRFGELGGSTDARNKLKEALTEATGAAKADEVAIEDYPKAYSAIMALE